MGNRRRLEVLKASVLSPDPREIAVFGDSSELSGFFALPELCEEHLFLFLSPACWEIEGCSGESTLRTPFTTGASTNRSTKSSSTRRALETESIWFDVQDAAKKSNHYTWFPTYLDIHPYPAWMLLYAIPHRVDIHGPNHGITRVAALPRKSNHFLGCLCSVSDTPTPRGDGSDRCCAGLF